MRTGHTVYLLDSGVLVAKLFAQNANLPLDIAPETIFVEIRMLLVDVMTQLCIIAKSQT